MNPVRTGLVSGAVAVSEVAVTRLEYLRRNVSNQA